MVVSDKKVSNAAEECSRERFRSNSHSPLMFRLGPRL